MKRLVWAKAWVAVWTPLICALSLMAYSLGTLAAERPTEPLRLWAESEPVSPDRERIQDERVSGVDNPSITPFWPETPNGSAVLIFPGGGYERLAWEKEGVKAAQWLNSLGVTAFIVKYRMQEYGHPAPLLDGLRAVRYVRVHADTWSLEQDRIGVLGFSAGGHLAGSVALRSGFTHADLDDDPWGRVSARPDFALLLYPVVTMEDPYTHGGSRRALLGEDLSQEARREHSLEHQVSEKAPPLFLVHGSGDESVPVQNSLMLFEAALPHSPASELHIYQTQRHGFGLEPDEGSASFWPEAAEHWLRVNEFLD